MKIVQAGLILLIFVAIGCTKYEVIKGNPKQEQSEEETPTDTENTDSEETPNEDVNPEDDETFKLLDGATDIVQITGKFTERYEADEKTNRVFDAREAEFITGIPKWGSIDIKSDASITGMVWAGGYAHSTKAWDTSWDKHKATFAPDLQGRNSTPIDNRSVGTTITGMYVRNVHDAFRSSSATDWRVQHCWASYVRDDAIENDKFGAGSVYDCLFDSAYTGFSSRPDDTDLDAKGNVISLEKVLLRLQAMPYPYKWDEKPDTIDENNEPYTGTGIPYGHGDLFKIFEDNNSQNMHWNIKDCVFLMANNVRDSKFDFPDPSLIDECSNVTIIWLGNGEFPGYLPEEKFPNAFTILTGQEGRNLWTEKVTDWHERHPNVGADHKPISPGSFVFPEKF